MTEEERKERLERLERVSAEVATWPKWKRNLLKNALKPTFKKPRPVVPNPDTDCY